MKICCNIEVDVKEVADNLNRAQSKEIIKYIDSETADLNFTLEMCRYFLGEMKEEFEAAGGEGFDKFTIKDILEGDEKIFFSEEE